MTKEKIRHGYYNAFYAFKLFESDNSIEQYTSILKLLKESGISISAETLEGEVSFMSSFEDFVQERKRNYRKLKEKESSLPEYLLKSIEEVDEKPTVAIGHNLEISFIDNLIDELEESQHYSLQQLVLMYQAEEQYTGLATKNYKNKFVLFPPFLSDSQKSFHPSIFLTVFKHGYAIIHLTMEIEDMTYEELNMSIWDLEFEDVLMPELLTKNNTSYEMTKNKNCTSANLILAEYGNFIERLVNFETNEVTGEYFYHLVLSDFAYNIKSFEENDSDKLNETLFKLLYAPINNYQIRTKTETKRFLESKYMSFSKTKRVYANHNRTISLYTKDFKDAIKDAVEDSEDLDHPHYLNSVAHNTSLGAMISAIELILLKKLVIQRFSVFEIHEDTSLKKLLNLSIKENTDYAIDFTKYFYTYGSVRELISFLENECEDYLQTNLMNERRMRLEKVINLKKEKEVASFTALGPLVTILFTILFSYPALDTILKGFGKGAYINSIYIVVNLVSLSMIGYFFRNRFFELISDVKNTFWPKSKNIYWKLAIKYYNSSNQIFEILNSDIKEVNRLLFKQGGIKKRQRRDSSSS